MDPIMFYAALTLGFILLILQWVKLAELSRKSTDIRPILETLYILQNDRALQDRTMREDISRHRQEQANDSHALRVEVVATLMAVGDSVGAKVGSLSQSHDQRAEQLRAALEQRLDSFASESARKTDALTQSLSASSALLRDEVSARLGDLKNSLEVTVREAHQLQWAQMESVSGAIRTLEASIEQRQLQLQNAVDSRLTMLGQQTGQNLSQIEVALRDQAQQLRQENGVAFKNLGQSVLSTLTEISQLQKMEMQDLKTTVDSRLTAIQSDNEKKLDQMRHTVDEKLQGTLEARLGESFRQVSERLEQVYSGLGEMKALATGVGDLKRVLTNVKTRGTWGEVQLGAIIEQILAPDQFAKNVATSGTGERVEYAVKLPGRDGGGEPVWLPIDARFPMEDFLRLTDASERGDGDAAEKASRQLETTLRFSARGLSENYLAPPFTTDFGILFLSSEGLYAEAMRRPGFADAMQREYRVVLSGPSTLAALLNALQMGFRTLAIQKQSSEVWETLGSVKTEFGKYAQVLAIVKKKLSQAQDTIDQAETRTRAIQRTLRDVRLADAPQLSANLEAAEPEEESVPVLASALQEG
jgi:DNA recombination protein RmuC